jgi:hypothetical protein
VSNEFRKAADVINNLFTGFSAEGMEQSNSFLRSWKDIVGEKVGAHSKIVDVDRGNVIVEVDHPGWSQQILFRKKQIVTSLAQNYPSLSIKGLVIRVVTECRTPYRRQEAPVGSGIPRAPEVEPDVPVNEGVPDELKAVLERLKASIRSGKTTD